MNAPVILLERVRKTFGPLCAVDDLSLSVAAGEVLALLGHNGAGKTTTIKIILGIIAATGGRVEVLGESPLGRNAHDLRLRIGYLPESVSFYEQLTGREVLNYFARLKQVGAARCDELLDWIGLAAAADRRVKTYSKGMRQRLGLAQALLRPPELLLLDEPTVGLDPLATRDFFATIDKLRREGTTVIMCSHVLPGIEQHIDRTAIMANGRLRAMGTLEQLRHQTGLPYIIRALGEWHNETLGQRLKQHGIERFRLNATHVELETGLDGKMDAMRLLLDNPAIKDIEVLPPTLEALYAHFNTLPDAGES